MFLRYLSNKKEILEVSTSLDGESLRPIPKNPFTKMFVDICRIFKKKSFSTETKHKYDVCLCVSIHLPVLLRSIVG